MNTIEPTIYLLRAMRNSIACRIDDLLDEAQHTQNKKVVKEAQYALQQIAFQCHQAMRDLKEQPATPAPAPTPIHHS